MRYVSTAGYGLASLVLLLAGTAVAQTKSMPLASVQGLTLHNTTASGVTFLGRKALRLTISPEAEARMRAAGLGEGAGKKKGGTGPEPGTGEAGRLDHLALVDGVEFSNGTIEVDLAGEPAPGASGAARGFVGLAFRVQPDRRTYDCFYVRPTNGRADDQERRNHAVQYISHPEYTWFKLRQETPSRYESYADMGPGEWIHLKLEVSGEKARLYVNGATQPTLLVNDLKTGAAAKGGVALWFEGSTIAHFANLKITAR